MNVILSTAVFAFLYYAAARKTAGTFGVKLDLPSWWTPVLSTVIAAALVSLVALAVEAMGGSPLAVFGVFVLAVLVVLNVLVMRRGFRDAGRFTRG